MSLFKQVRITNGSRPVTHIAEVLGVSFVSPKMTIKVISSFPSYVIPPEDAEEAGAEDAEEAGAEAEAYYHPGVPYSTEDYDPALSLHPPINSEYMSARYFMVGEKVSVIQSGQMYFVVSSVYPAVKPGLEPEHTVSHRNLVGEDVEHIVWLSQLNGAVPWKDGDGPAGDPPRVFLLSNNALVKYDFTEDNPFLRDYAAIHSGYYPCYNLVQTLNLNQAYPILVGINKSTVSLSTWTWGKGSYNFMYSEAPRPQLVDETIETFSCLFPTPLGDLRLEAQPSAPGPTSYTPLYRPDIEFYVTESDIGYGQNSETRDFVHMDDHSSMLFSIARPWGNQPTNSRDWRTLNWMPNILAYPVIDGDSFTITYGFIEYAKSDYVTPIGRNVATNTFHVLTGSITATVKLDSVGSSMLKLADYDLVYSNAYATYTSAYDLQIVNTGTNNPIVPGNSNTWVQTTTLNDGSLPDQYFSVANDGTHVLKKFPKVTFIDTLIREYEVIGNTDTIYKELDLEVEHYLDGVLCFTSLFTYNTNTGIENSKLYYLLQVDIANGYFIADVYTYDKQLDTQSITRVAIDSNTHTEYTIWSYTPFSPSIGIPVNIPPWGLDTNFPEHPSVSSFVGSESLVYEELIWKTPFYGGLNFPVNTTPGSTCSVGNANYAFIVGVNYPCGPLDEDIYSILLLTTAHYSSTYFDLIQAKEHVFMTPRPNGWLAYGKCCLDPDQGVIDYPYGTDVIINTLGTIAGAPELYNPATLINTN